MRSVRRWTSCWCSLKICVTLGVVSAAVFELVLSFLIRLLQTVRAWGVKRAAEDGSLCLLCLSGIQKRNDGAAPGVIARVSARGGDSAAEQEASFNVIKSG